MFLGFVFEWFHTDFCYVSVGIFGSLDVTRQMVTLSGGLHAPGRGCCFKGQALPGSA